MGGRGEAAEPHRWEPRRSGCPSPARTLLTTRPARVQCCISVTVGHMTFRLTTALDLQVGASTLLPGGHPLTLLCKPDERACCAVDYAISLGCTAGELLDGDAPETLLAGLLEARAYAVG